MSFKLSNNFMILKIKKITMEYYLQIEIYENIRNK